MVIPKQLAKVVEILAGFCNFSGRSLRTFKKLPPPQFKMTELPAHYKGTERKTLHGPGPDTKGGGYRGGPKRWTGGGPAPARHIPWPEVKRSDPQ